MAAMGNATVSRRHPTVDEFIALRRAAGWKVPDDDVVRRGIDGATFSYCAETDGQTVGMARVIADGAMYYYVQDVIVLPAYQHKGIGRLLMDAVMDEIEAETQSGACIALFSAPGLEPFYARYGFVTRPHGDLGPGMVYIKR